MKRMFMIAVALFAASLPSCRSGWHRRTSRRSISGGMGGGVSACSSVSTRRRRQSRSAHQRSGSMLVCFPAIPVLSRSGIAGFFPRFPRPL